MELHLAQLSPGKTVTGDSKIDIVILDSETTWMAMPITAESTVYDIEDIILELNGRIYFADSSIPTEPDMLHSHIMGELETIQDLAAFESHHDVLQAKQTIIDAVKIEKAKMVLDAITHPAFKQFYAWQVGQLERDILSREEVLHHLKNFIK